MKGISHMYCLVVAIVLATWTIQTQAFGVDPARTADPDFPQNVYVDCIAGSDYFGDGSATNPYQTLVYTTANTPITDWLITVNIVSFPCNEPTHTPVNGFCYVGSGTTQITITNGLAYTATGAEFVNFVFVNLNIQSLYLNAALMAPGWDFKFFESTIASGSIIGNNNYQQYAGSFYHCVVNLASTSGLTSLYDSASAIPNIGYQGNLLVQGGSFSGTTVMDQQSNVRFIGNYIGTATFTSTQTDLNQPTMTIGSLTTNVPTTSGITVITYKSDGFDRFNGFTSATIGSGGTVSVAIPVPIYGKYIVSLEPSSAALLVPWVSSKTSTSFVIHGTAGATVNYVLVKQ